MNILQKIKQQFKTYKNNLFKQTRLQYYFQQNKLDLLKRGRVLRK